MRLIIRASDEAYSKHIQNEDNAGRLPLAWITWGSITGRGWGFLGPWTQQAIFPHKGKPGSGSVPGRLHEPFLVVCFRRRWGFAHHRNHAHEILGRFGYGLVWRKSWGFRPRWARLDPEPGWRWLLPEDEYGNRY